MQTKDKKLGSYNSNVWIRELFNYKNPSSIDFFVFFFFALIPEMQLLNFVVPFVLAGIASATNATVTTDIVVTDFTTYCPLPTSLTINNKTLTVTEASTLTITGPITIPTTTTVANTSTPAPSSVAEISTENGAAQVCAGALAGVAAVAAVLL